MKARTRTGANLEVETELWGSVPLVVGMDEVGRGAIAGPVSVGVAVVAPTCGPPPAGLTDSKMLRADEREDYLPLIAQWCVATAVGHASAREVDTLGIIGALRRAGRRALAGLTLAEALRDAGPLPLVLLDGSHDWLSTPPSDLLSLLDGDGDGDEQGADVPPWHDPRVVTRVKADMMCASVAAASVVAKCARDAIVLELANEHPGYGWEHNKGYGTADHRESLERLGVNEQHRSRGGCRASVPPAGDLIGADTSVGVTAWCVSQSRSVAPEGAHGPSWWSERRGSGELRDRHGARALPRVP